MKLEKWQASLVFWVPVLAGIALVFNSLISFELFMVLLLAFTGLIWLLDIGVFKKKRTAGTPEPEIVDYARSFFPVILVVFMFRSFLLEPFKIPSGSMMPTLLAGDFILVNKYTYGIRIPVVNKKLIEFGNPQRGDVMVFRYPENPSVDYIKRVVGLPGDLIEYRNKQLYINSALQQQKRDGEYNYIEGRPVFVHTEKNIESLGEHDHAVLINPEMPDVHIEAVADFPHYENCTYTVEMFRCKVPDNSYFMMGDNRDNSRDSRYWGFVPDDMIVGKAFAVWMNFGDLKRVGLRVN